MKKFVVQMWLSEGVPYAQVTVEAASCTDALQRALESCPEAGVMTVRIESSEVSS